MIFIKDRDDIINFLEKGDILITDFDTNFGRAMDFVGLEYSHSAVYIGMGKIIEETGGGVQIETLDRFMSSRMKALVSLRIKNENILNIDRFINYMKEQLRLEYSIGQVFLSAILFLIYIIFGKDFRKTIKKDFFKGMVCSELIAYALYEQKIYFGVTPAYTSPDTFINDNRFEKIIFYKQFE